MNSHQLYSCEARLQIGGEFVVPDALRLISGTMVTIFSTNKLFVKKNSCKIIV